MVAAPDGSRVAPVLERLSEAAVVAAQSEAPSDPRDIVMPKAPNGVVPELRAFFEAEGAPLVGLMSVSEQLWRDAPLGEEQCGSVAEGLTAIGSPNDLRALATAIEDDVTQDVLSAVVGTSGRALVDCGADVVAVGDLAWQWTVALRRLNYLGVGVP